MNGGVGVGVFGWVGFEFFEGVEMGFLFYVGVERDGGEIEVLEEGGEVVDGVDCIGKDEGMVGGLEEEDGVEVEVFFEIIVVDEVFF